VDHLSPGAVIKRRVLLLSNLTVPRQIEVYPGAATIGNGAFHGGEGHATDELTSWISLDHDTVDMQPGDKTPVEVTIRVPATAATGERYGAIWASLSTEGDPSSNGKINAVNRVGVRIYLDIGPGPEPRSDFTIGTAVPTRDDHGKPTITVAVTNTGARAVDISGQLNLSDGPDHRPAGPIPVSTTTLAPGEHGTVTAMLPDHIAGGPWKIAVDLISGTVKHTATRSTTFAQTGNPGKPSALSSHTTAWLTIGGSLVVALAALTGLVVASRRSGRRRTPAQ
jgi:hypothetical protein